jgi:hypothetical protein
MFFRLLNVELLSTPVLQGWPLQECRWAEKRRNPLGNRHTNARTQQIRRFSGPAEEFEPAKRNFW